MPKIKNSKKRLMKRVTNDEPRALKRWADLADYREDRRNRLTKTLVSPVTDEELIAEKPQRIDITGFTWHNKNENF